MVSVNGLLISIKCFLVKYVQNFKLKKNYIFIKKVKLQNVFSLKYNIVLIYYFHLTAIYSNYNNTFFFKNVIKFNILKS